MGPRLSRRLITLISTHWAARNLVQVSPAYVAPLKIIKVVRRLTSFWAAQGRFWADFSPFPKRQKKFAFQHSPNYKKPLPVRPQLRFWLIINALWRSVSIKLHDLAESSKLQHV